MGVLTDDFVDHAPDGSKRDATEVIAAYRALAGYFLGATIGVRDIQAVAGHLVVSIEPVEFPPVEIAGLHLTAGPLPARTEILLTHDGKISQRWSRGPPVLAATSFPDAGFRMGAHWHLTVRLERVFLPPGAMVRWRGESLVAMVESGTVLAYRVDSPNDPSRPHEMIVIESGNAAKLPSGQTTQIENPGDRPAEMLLFWVERPTAFPQAPHRFEGGSTSSPVWAHRIPMTGNTPWDVAFGRIASATDGALSLSGPPDGMTVLVAGSGLVRVRLSEGSVSWSDHESKPIDAGRSSSIAAGEVVSIVDSETIDLQTGGEVPSTIWIISLHPSSASTSSGRSFERRLFQRPGWNAAGHAGSALRDPWLPRHT